jgi:hypothetical protein
MRAKDEGSDPLFHANTPTVTFATWRLCRGRSWTSNCAIQHGLEVSFQVCCHLLVVQCLGLHETCSSSAPVPPPQVLIRRIKQINACKVLRTGCVWVTRRMCVNVVLLLSLSFLLYKKSEARKGQGISLDDTATW